LPDFQDIVVQILWWLLSLSWLVVMGVVVFHFVIALVLIIPTWRICRRAGFSGGWALLHLVPVLGSFIVMAILAFGDWPNGEAAPSHSLAGGR
jgi:hypothetical protein